MDNNTLTLLTAIIVPVATSVITFLGARHQSNAEIKKMVNQQNLEMEKLKTQQESELLKLKEQHDQEIEKLKIAMETQAGLYEKNTQTDLMKDVFKQIINGDTTGIDSLMKVSKQVNSGSNGLRYKRR